MQAAILCLCLASTAYAAPFQYLHHYTASRPQVPIPQVKSPFPAVFPQPSIPGAYSVELIYPHRFGGAAAGLSPAQPFSSYGLIKYSIPQPPGRQSVEVYYPYDFSQQRIITNLPPMTNNPSVPDVLPFEYPPQSFPQQPLNNPTFEVNALPSQDPLPVQQDQPVQTSQMPAKA